MRCVAPQAETYRFRPDIAYREVGGEFYFLSADSMFHSVTDPVGAFVLQLLEKDKTVTMVEVVEAVVASFEVDEESAKQDMTSFVDELVRKGVLEAAPA